MLQLAERAYWGDLLRPDGTEFSASPQMKSITVGSVIGRAGEQVSGFIDVPDGADPGAVIPVTVATGERDGPILALVAGIHGSEPSPIMSLQRVRRELDVAELSGT